MAKQGWVVQTRKNKNRAWTTNWMTACNTKKDAIDEYIWNYREYDCGDDEKYPAGLLPDLERVVRCDVVAKDE